MDRAMLRDVHPEGVSSPLRGQEEAGGAIRTVGGTCLPYRSGLGGVLKPRTWHCDGSKGACWPAVRMDATHLDPISSSFSTAWKGFHRCPTTSEFLAHKRSKMHPDQAHPDGNRYLHLFTYLGEGKHLEEKEVCTIKNGDRFNSCSFYRP